MTSLKIPAVGALSILTLLASFGLGSPPAVGTGTGEATTTMSATLQAPSWQSAVWTGEFVYVFGGLASGDRSDEIRRYDPVLDVSTPMGARLPTARSGTSAVWDGTYAYVFGGYDGSWLDEILRYDPVADEIVRMNARLPYAASGTSAVWTGDHTLIFGGGRQEIQRYDPLADMADVAPGTVPYGDRVSAVWTGEAAYVLGGWLDPYWAEVRTVVRYDPASGSAETVGSLRYGVADAPVAWDGEHVYLLGGGYYVNSAESRIQRFDPETDETVIMRTRLPYAPYRATAVATPEGLFVLGGKTALGGGGAIARYRPGLDAPNHPPEAVAAPIPSQVECENGKGEVPVDGSGSTDADGDALSFFWRALPGFAASWSTADTLRVPVGHHFVSLQVSDGLETAHATAGAVDVVDTVPPSLTVLRPGHGELYVFDERSEEPSPTGTTTAVGHLTLAADAADACGVEMVVFETSLGQRFEDHKAPYTFVSGPPVGAVEVEVKVTAVDLGGNTAAQGVEFLQVGTEVANLGKVLPPFGNEVHEQCRSQGLEAACTALIGPDPYPSW